MTLLKMGNPVNGFEFKEYAEEIAQRIDASIFATSEERALTKTTLSAIIAAGTHESAGEEVSLLESTLQAVVSRESGRSQLTSSDRQRIEQSLAFLEDRLINEIKDRKASQRRDLFLLLSLLSICVLGSLSGGIFLAIHGTTSANGTAGAALGLATGVGCSVVVARLLQNSREAMERLDEKILAVRFLRMALHPSWTTELGGRLIEPALLMFAQHFAPASATLGVEDTANLLENLRPPDV